MKKYFVKFFLKAGFACLTIANVFRLSKSDKKWVKDKGSETLRLDYDELDEHSIVFDIGGYKGQWASDIFSKYLCQIYIFEPIRKYASVIKKRFKKNSKIHVYFFGLSDKNKKTRIAVEEDSSSIYKKGQESAEIEIVNITEFLKSNNIQHIDLMKINIEGEEYDLLDALVQSGFVENIMNIQVQFHDFVENAESRMKKVQSELSKTHKLTYQYLFVFENWKRIDS